jgi:two-component system, OmpR family, sensor histidine kinase MtrB
VRSLRVRLLIAFTLLTGFTAAAVSGMMYVNARDEILRQVQDAAVQEFQNEVATATTLDDVITALSDREDAVIVFYRGRSARPNTPAVSEELRWLVRTGYVAWQRVETLGHVSLVIGTRVGAVEIYVIRSLSTVEVGVSDLSSLAWATGSGAVLVATLLALYAAWSVLRPVRDLNTAALRLGQGDLTSRVPVRGKDELATVATTFNNTAAALEKQVADAKRFVADVSHELRTPLAAMTAVTDILDEEAPRLGSDAGKAAELVSQETRNLTRLVNDLMEISRFDAGAAALTVAEVDVPATVTATVRTRGWLEQVVLDLQPVTARLDPRRLDVIVANLVGNALRHGAPPVTVRLSAERGWLSITVRDSGPGLAPDVLPQVFNRFYKADTARSRTEGSGLGLAIAWENAELHHGSLFAANHPDGGAVFTLHLPLTDGAP